MNTGNIWLAQFVPMLGSEIRKTRRCVLISLDDMNAHLRAVVVVPMTAGSRPAYFCIAMTLHGKQGTDRAGPVANARPSAPGQAIH